MRPLRPINRINVVIVLLILVVFFAVWQIISWQIDKRGNKIEVINNDPELASIPELMDALNIFMEEEPWIAPGFDLESIDGKRGRLSDYGGNYVLLTFWATW
ncbi:MAG: hypothetical protein JSV21_11085 [Nitrospirota bacterium]|nr:MAG: hypothetical protein JSV21_11085 [Nitrospirota bacterium]